MHTREKGKAGEDQAADYLLERGYSIVARNYKLKRGELDIVAKSPEGVLVFVEVKVALSHQYGHPLFWVTRQKQMRIAQMARQYCARHAMVGPLRLDVIAIKDGKLDHLRNAFLV